MTEQRALLTEALAMLGHGVSDPDPFTWAEFFRAWESACVDAYEAGRQEPSVVLPYNVFPGVKSVQNPLTGNMIPIVRRSPFEWDTSRCSCGNAA